MMMMMNNEDEYEDEYSQTLSKKRKSNKNNKRRFSDDQIKSLETIFESESKLEPRKKLQLARELGLQPRQVAIWFQNKRARYKSKQLEQDYGTLRADYNNLASQFETLEKDKQALQAQLQKLNDQMNKSRAVNQDRGVEAKSKLEPRPTISDDNSSIKAGSFGINKELKSSFSLEKSEHNISVLSDEDSSIKTEYFGFDEEPELLNMLDPVDSTLTSPENWGSLEREGLLDQSGSSYQWWDVWN